MKSLTFNRVKSTNALFINAFNEIGALSNIQRVKFGRNYINIIFFMHVFSYLFWISLGVIFYNYVGYGLLLFPLTQAKKMIWRSRSRRAFLFENQQVLPEVTLVVAAYNERAFLREKIKNCQDLNYPSNKFFLLFITDGSTDDSNEIILEFPQINLLFKPGRNGKTAALNRAMKYVQSQITIFSDANTMLNKDAIINIANHYVDPRTGGVSGEKRIHRRTDSETSAGEGLYWRYESLLKKMDSELYTVTGAAGELFSIRTSLWEPLPDNIILDDFVISTRINLKGYRIAYEPQAYAIEMPTASFKDERKRKIRICAGGFQAMKLLYPIFNVFRNPILFFQFISHRFLRWTLTPLCFPILLIANVLMVINRNTYYYEVALIAQATFYVFALSGNFLANKNKHLKLLRIFHYILFMNYSVYLGFIRFIKGKQSVVWEKVNREVIPIHE